MKTYKIMDDGHWSYNGCSCCESDYVEVYNVNPDDFPITGSDFRNSISDIKLDILIENNIIAQDRYNDDSIIDWSYIDELFVSNGFDLVFV